MNQLIIKDNTRKNREAFSDIATVTTKIADKTIGCLENEGVFVFPEITANSADISKDQYVLKSINDSYVTGNVMGFLGYGDERLIIESRFSNGSNDYFFQYLLEYVMEIPNILDMKTDSSQDNKFLNVLLFLFPYYLRNAMRKGLYKTYIKKKYNDAEVKGIIDFPRHIHDNIPFTGNIAYSTREHSYDNYLTELIRHTIEFLKKKPFGNTILNKAKDEVKQIINATPKYEPFDRRKIIVLNKNNTIRHAFFREYRILQQLCILILQHQKTHIGYGSRQIYGILFDGAWLWEEYMNILIKDSFYHPMNKSSSGGQRLFSGGVGLIYPDFIGRNPDNRVIADAKYKPVNNISSSDYQQILAYMFRFDAKTGYFLYPETEQSEDKTLWLNKGITFEKNVSARDDIYVKKYGLNIPADAQNYEDFVLKIKESEQSFVSSFLF